jgi:hypothetical protein
MSGKTIGEIGYEAKGGVNYALFDYIYRPVENGGLGAIYDANYKEAPSNLNRNKEKNQEYLGTYFPRSFMEAYTIFSDVFDFYHARKIKFGKEINIVDIGAGTGGATFGLLQAMADKKQNWSLQARQ